MTAAARSSGIDRSSLLDEIEERFIAGETVESIAADMGVTSRTVQNWFLADGRPRLRETRDRWVVERLRDEDWLRIRIERGATREDIAHELRISPTRRIGDALDALGITRPPKPTRPGLSPAELAEAFDAGHSASSWARELGVERTVVRRAMKKAGYTTGPYKRPPGERPWQLDDRRWMREEYRRKGRTMTSIGDELGVSYTTVSAALEALGIECRPGGGCGQVTRWTVHDPVWMEQRYLKDRARISTIAEQLGVSERAVRRSLRRLGLTRSGSNTRSG